MNIKITSLPVAEIINYTTKNVDALFWVVEYYTTKGGCTNNFSTKCAIYTSARIVGRARYLIK